MAHINPEFGADGRPPRSGPSRSPRDAPFQHGPRYTNNRGGSGRGRPQQSGNSRYGAGLLAQDDDDLDDLVNGDKGDSDGLEDDDMNEMEVEEEFGARKAFEDLDDPKYTPTTKQEVAEKAFAEMDTEEPDNEEMTDEEEEEHANWENWIRLECATMPPVPEALPTFKPGEVSVASLLQGTASLPIGTHGVDHMINLQLQRATKQADLGTTIYDWHKRRFRKGHLVAFKSQEEMNWALFRQNWEAKAEKIIGGEEISFKDVAERAAVADIVFDRIVESVKERHPTIKIQTKEDLEHAGVALADAEIAILNRLAVLAKETSLPENPEQADVIRSILKISVLTDDQKKEMEKKYPEFVPVGQDIRENVMGKMVAGKYESGGEKTSTAGIQSLVINNGSYLPAQQKNLMEKIKSYIPQAR